MAAGICVDVAKYSHAIGENKDRTIPWSHLTSSDMSLVLKGEDTDIQNGRLCMQIVQGNAAHETVDVGELIDSSVEVRSRHQQRTGNMPHIEQLPIFGIHKEIYLAFRYRLSDNQPHRVQLKLKSAQDSAVVMEILKRRGMEFQQQRPGTARVKTARLGTSSSQERPMTVQASYSANRAFAAPPDPLKPSPIRMPVLEAGDFSSQHSQHFGNMEGSFSFQRPQKQSLLQFPTHSNPLQKEPTHSITTYGTDNSMVAPDLSRSNTAPFQRSMQNAATSYSDMSNQMHTTTTSNHRQDEPVTEHFSKAPALLSEPSSAPLETRDIASSSTENRTSLYRPSLPPSIRMPETLEHEMPPRRELPFKRPESHQSSSSRPSSTSKSVYYNATGGSSDPPMTSSISSPARKSRPGTAASVKSAAAPRIAQLVDKAQAVHARPRSHASTLRKTSSGKSNARIAKSAAQQSSIRRPSDIGELLRITKPLSERSPNSNKVSRMDSTADAAYELDTPPRTSSSPGKTITHEVTGAAHQSGSSTTQPGAEEAASLAAYASQSREDRQTALDEFMISKLEDPNFAVLCEDLDTCWRKIALGL